MPGYDSFDEYARDYTDILNETLSTSGADRDYFARDRVRRVAEIESANGRAPQDILDLGCGDGATGVHFQRTFPAARVRGVDVSAESIAVALGRGLPRCEFSHYDGERLPYADGTFDLVYLAAVIHHVAEDEHRVRLFAEIARVLRPGGSAYVFEHNPFNPMTRRIVDRCPFDDHARLIGARDLREIVAVAGLLDAETHYIHFAPRHRLFAPIHAVEPWLHRVPAGAQYFVVALAPSYEQRA